MNENEKKYTKIIEKKEKKNNNKKKKMKTKTNIKQKQYYQHTEHITH